ncbi:hypothetical protein OF83DRAFT_1092562 [Amylostereum chailletii]|nr:hypothetical protein OF83DRAFT_1092562 [Amylostereum chailletii]
MDDENSPSARSSLERWEHLFREQSSIFRDTLNRSEELQAEVDELRRELSVWKAGYKNSEDEKKTLEKVVTKLERSIDAMKDDNSLIFCVIDGDGTIFSQDLWPLGRPGGRQAAMLLAKGLSDHASNMDDIFCNKGGLKDTLLHNDICTGEQFEDFLHGFNQASPLFSIVDVGAGKEAADSKIKEHLRVFTRFPQTARIYFGGAHDNGYSTTLNFLENEGLLDKIVLLRGYKNLALELKNFDLPHLEIDGLFMSYKLQTAYARHYSTSPVKQPIPLYEQDNPKPDDRYVPEERAYGPPQKYIDPTLVRTAKYELTLESHLYPCSPWQSVCSMYLTTSLYQLCFADKPPPCTWHYLTKCRTGAKCRFGHDYVVTPDTLAILRLNAKRSPCPAAATSLFPYSYVVQKY